MKSQFPGYWAVEITVGWPFYQGHTCGTLGNKLPHSLPEALILQAPTPHMSLPPPLQDVQDNQIRAPKGRTTWTREKFTWLHWEGTIRVKYHFVWRASHRNQTRNTKGMLNIQIYSNFPLIKIHIFTYLNILVCTKGMCMYIYFSGEDSVPCFPSKLLADLELSSLWQHCQNVSSSSCMWILVQESGRGGDRRCIKRDNADECLWSAQLVNPHDSYTPFTHSLSIEEPRPDILCSQQSDLSSLKERA